MRTASAIQALKSGYSFNRLHPAVRSRQGAVKCFQGARSAQGQGPTVASHSWRSTITKVGVGACTLLAAGHLLATPSGAWAAGVPPSAPALEESGVPAAAVDYASSRSWPSPVESSTADGQQHDDGNEQDERRNLANAASLHDLLAAEKQAHQGGWVRVRGVEEAVKELGKEEAVKEAVQGGMSKLRDAVDWVPGTVGHALAKAEGQILEAEGRMVCRVRGKSWLQCRRSSHPVACCLGLESMAKSPGP